VGPDPEKGSWLNVYSLIGFEPTAIPYEEIWALDGFNEGDNFMGLRFLDKDKGQVVLDGLRITTATRCADAAAAERALAASLAPTGKLVPPESVNVAGTSYEAPLRHVLVNRAEALLVKSYRDSLPPNLEVNRLRLPVGVTDLHVTGPGLVDVVEAKAGIDHRYVRQALGQLLDYAVHCPQPPTRLTALFPSQPGRADVRLLHRYGIDCVYLAFASWNREPAPPLRYAKVLSLLTEAL